ncbi:MAG: phosphotransferase [Spirosomataceae bacterium]
MVLEPYNLIRYLLSKDILQFDLSSCRITTSELSRPDARNCVVEVCIENSNDELLQFIAKQPRYFDNDSIKFINNERNFYDFANKNKIDSIGKFVDFDDYNKILFLKKREDLEVFTYDSFFKLEHSNHTEFFSKIATKLQESHKKTEKFNTFEKVLDAYLPFVNIKNLLNEFPKFQKYDYSDKPKFSNFYDLVSDINYQIKIIKILNKWQNDCIIHGDFHYKNILHGNNGNNFAFIDFELAGIGDRCWDIACFIHSILIDRDFLKRTLTTNLNEFINNFLLGYQNVDKEKIIQFIAVKAIWHCWITLFNEDLKIKIDLIKKMIDYPSSTFNFEFLIPRY